MFGRKKEQEEEKTLGFDISEFEEKEQEEIKRVEQMLEAAEKIKTVARQSRIRPGGSLVTPNIIFATNKRIIIRDPSTLGLRSGVESIPYSQINKVHLEKGAFSSELVLDVGQYEGGDNEQKIPSIPKKKAEEILSIIHKYIRGAQDFTTHAPPPPVQDDDPLTILKKRLAKGEISKEEYEGIKSALE